MNKEVAVQNDNMMSIIEKAVSNPDIDVEKMERLLNMQERIFDKNVEIEFNRSMSECQKHMPSITRDGVNDQTRSKYAKFETILKTIKPIYTEHGFSLSFGTDASPFENQIRVICEVMHAAGHSKQFHVDLPPDMTGIKGSVNKTGVHATGSTYSYAKRYLVGMIFNIANSDEDDDGVSAGGVTIQDLLEHLDTIREHIHSISAIKAGIANNNYGEAREAWVELDQDEQRAIWKAPSKGGMFTTLEREIMKTKEFREAHQSEE